LHHRQYVIAAYIVCRLVDCDHDQNQNFESYMAPWTNLTLMPSKLRYTNNLIKEWSLLMTVCSRGIEAPGFGLQETGQGNFNVL